MLKKKLRSAWIQLITHQALAGVFPQFASSVIWRRKEDGDHSVFFRLFG